MTKLMLGKIPVDLNIAPLQECHGVGPKTLFVFHETVSPDYRGLVDIVGVSAYMAKQDLGIHSIVDAEGNLGWAVGKRNCLLYHTASSGDNGNGQVNARSIGCELVSRVMLDYRTNILRWQAWWERRRQIEKAAKLLAWCSRVEKFPLAYTDARIGTTGVTTHWQVTQTFGVDGGHTDCWPRHLGGYFPVLHIIERAKYYRKLGY